jgi:hypothetical protein
LGEYLDAALQANFAVESIDDVSAHAAPFWSTTLALMTVEMEEASFTPIEAERLRVSIEAHARVRDGVLSGGLRHLLLSFVKN